MDQLYQYILSYDITGLRDYWDYLNDRFFKRLDYQHNSNVKKLEMCLLRLYIVHAIQNSKNDKVVEFFEKFTSELQTQTEWREWFGKLMFVKIVRKDLLVFHECLLPVGGGNKALIWKWWKHHFSCIIMFDKHYRSNVSYHCLMRHVSFPARCRFCLQR